MRRRLRPTGLLLLCASLTLSCAGRFASPPQLSPPGVVAFHAARVTKGIAALQDVAIAGEASGAIDRNDARAIVRVTEIAGQSQVALATALAAGIPRGDGATALDRAITILRSVLTDLPGVLTEQGRQLIAPYLLVILTALAAVEP